MVGIKYNRYQPKLIHMLDSGLGIYISPFLGPDGSRAVVGGPHPLVSKMECHFSQQSKAANGRTISMFFSSQLQMYLDGYDISPHSGLKWSGDLNETSCYSARTLNKFQQAEHVGTEASYRCRKCRACKDCKCGPYLEEVSRKAEDEQQIINNSVTFNEKDQRLECVLPLTDDPAKALANNKSKALKVYHQWVWKLKQKPE